MLEKLQTIIDKYESLREESDDEWGKYQKLLLPLHS